jgi:hypothetical protein
MNGLAHCLAVHVCVPIFASQARYRRSDASVEDQENISLLDVCAFHVLRQVQPMLEMPQNLKAMKPLVPLRKKQGARAGSQVWASKSVPNEYYEWAKGQEDLVCRLLAPTRSEQERLSAYTDSKVCSVAVWLCSTLKLKSTHLCLQL